MCLGDTGQMNCAPSTSQRNCRGPKMGLGVTRSPRAAWQGGGGGRGLGPRKESPLASRGSQAGGGAERGEVE